MFFKYISQDMDAFSFISRENCELNIPVTDIYKHVTLKSSIKKSLSVHLFSSVYNQPKMPQ